MAKRSNRVAAVRTSRPRRGPAPAVRSGDSSMIGWPMGWAGTGRNGDLVRSDNGAATAYSVIAIVYRCSNLISQAINALGWELVAGEGDDERVIASSEDRRPRHPFARAVQEVYAAQRLPLMALMVYSRLLFGETYIEKILNPYGFPRGLKWLNPIWVQPDTYTGVITSYRYGDKNGHRQVVLYPPEVAYDKTYNPFDDLRGYSTVDAALDALNIERNLKRSMRAFFRNNARPGIVVSPSGDGTFSPNDIDVIKQQLADFHLGVDKQNTALVAPIKALFEALELPDIQKQYSINSDIQREVCVAFGVPLAMAGDSSSSTFKDGEEVKRAFNEMTILPLARTLQDFINADVLPFFDSVSLYGEGTTFRFDVSSLQDELPGEKARTELVDMQVKGGYLTMGEGQRALGIETDPVLEPMYLINNVPVPREALPTYWERMLPPAAPAFGPGPFGGPPPQAPQPQAPLTEGNPPTIPPPPDAPSLPETSQKGTGGMSVILSLANNVDLLSLQRNLQSKFPESEIKWTPPDRFHVTLVSAPVVDDAALEQLVTRLSALAAPVFDLNIGSLSTFDALNEHALHFRIRANTALKEYQEDVYTLCEMTGIQMGQYSQPARWKPHITMGYAADPIPTITFSSSLRVSPTEVQISVKRDGGYEVVGQVRCGEAAALPVPAHAPRSQKSAEDIAALFPKPLPYGEWQAAALTELKAWQRHLKEKRPRPFEPLHTRGALADGIAAALADNAPLAGVFDVAFERVRTSAFSRTTERVTRAFTDGVRSWSDTRQEFEDEILLAIDDARKETLTKSGFISLMNDLIETLGEQAYIDGLSDSGVDDALNEDDKVTIASLVATQQGYVSSLADTLYAEGITDAQFDRKPQLWVSKTLTPFYQAAQAAADANALFEWVFGDTIEHCLDCERLSGQRHRMKDWVNSGYLPQSNGTKPLACGGWECLCKFVLVRGRSRGDF